MRTKSHLVVVLLLLATLAACASPPVPVAEVKTGREAIPLPHGGWDRIALHWTMGRALLELEGELRVALHVLDAAGELLRTFDHPFPGPWVVGEERAYSVEIFQSALGPPLAPGDYDLAIGLYDTAGHRWEVKTEDEADGRTRIAVVRSIEPDASFPSFSFSDDWLPTEAGGDRQILARRWLASDGAIRIRGVGTEGAIWLRLGIPRASERQDLLLAPDATLPAVSVVAECTGLEAELSGSGGHSLEIPLGPGGDPAGECRLEFRANFELVSKDNQEKRTIALENLAWSVGS